MRGKRRKTGERGETPVWKDGEFFFRKLTIREKSKRESETK